MSATICVVVFSVILAAIVVVAICFRWFAGELEQFRLAVDEINSNPMDYDGSHQENQRTMLRGDSGSSLRANAVAVHGQRDSLGCRLQDGQYVLRHGTRMELATIDRNEVVFSDGSRILTANLEPGVVLSRFSGPVLPSIERVSFLDAALRSAHFHRHELKQIELSLAEKLGGACGGSDLYDGVVAAVFDGRGSAIDLLEMAQ